MQSVIVSDVIVYWTAGNDADVFHYGTAVAGQTLSTGQPILFTTVTKAEWTARLVEHGIKVDTAGDPLPPNQQVVP